MIAPFWDDFVSIYGTTSVILYQFEDLIGDGSSDLLIEWQNAVLSGSNIDPFVTFQVILELDTGSEAGEIVFNYVDVDTTITGSVGDNSGNRGGRATVGINNGNAPAQSNQIGFNQANLLTSGTAIRFFVPE